LSQTNKTEGDEKALKNHCEADHFFLQFEARCLKVTHLLFFLSPKGLFQKPQAYQMQQGKLFLYAPREKTGEYSAKKPKHNTVALCGMRFAIRRHRSAQKKIATNLESQNMLSVCERKRRRRESAGPLFPLEFTHLCVRHLPRILHAARRSRPEAYVQQQAEYLS
jgi:hypothetical protein